MLETSFLKKNWVKDLLVFVMFLVLFVLLTWRLFAVGSVSQLFLYGDNLTAFNNLFYIFNHFSFKDIFGTFIGQNGMLGGYPMSEPQNSLFYLPITFLLILYKVFHLGAIGLYYELLISHTLHFVFGTFLVYKIAQRSLGLERMFAAVAGLVYMGIGWNVAWFGTATLSYMILLIPLTLFSFLRYLKSKRRQDYALFVLVLTLFLYGGGIVNFFFYLLLNLSFLFGAFSYFKLEKFSVFVSWSKSAQQFVLLFIVAPVLSLIAYAIQLFQTYRVSQDVFHSSSSYDYLAFFGTHFYDLIGLIVPKFGLINFGAVTSPDMVLDFSLANIMYVGIIPLLVLFLGFFCLKSKTFNVLAFLLFLNFILSFGGAFFLYDATYFFPGNNLFRGHYKYLMFSGLYFSLLVPFVLSRFELIASHARYQKIMNATGRAIWTLLFFAFVVSFTAMAMKFLAMTHPDLARYAALTMTFSSYFFRMVLFGVLSLVAISSFARYRNTAVLLVLALVLLLDTSINYKYEALNRTRIEALTSDTFFDCCQGKAVVNDIDKYSQLYYIPEILGINSLSQYSAIPNASLVEYNGYIGEGSGFSAEMLAGAGIEGVLTTKILDDPRFTLESTRNINSGNYRDLYLYSADGNIHNEWGEYAGAIGSAIRYYSIKDVTGAYFSNWYKEKTSASSALDYADSKDFNRFIPALSVGKKKSQNKDISLEHEVSRVSFLQNDTTYKKVQLHNESDEGAFFINIPYASFWQAKVNGKTELVYSANGAFLGVKVHEKNAVVEMYIDNRMSWVLLGLSLFITLLLISIMFLPLAWYSVAKKRIVAAIKRIFTALHNI